MVEERAHRPFQDSLQFLDTLIDWERQIGLTFSDDMMRLDLFRESLAHIGNPQDKLKIALVAGTKGKGSTASLLARLLTEHGYRTGLSTSPHLISVRERIRIDGEMISCDDFADTIGTLREGFSYFSEPGRSRTWFESITAAAFLHFARSDVDLAVVEVGLGGRLDATNVTDPALSILTPISRDHMHILGRSLLKIAGEKAAIMRPSRPAVIGRQRPAVKDFLLRYAASVGAKPYLYGRDFRGRKRADAGGAVTFDYIEQGGDRIDSIALSLLGEHQVWNAAAALQALPLLGCGRDDGKVRSACASTVWAGRGELFDQPGGDVLLDGAHNGDSAAVLARLVESIRPGGGHVLLFGASQGKELSLIFRRLIPFASEVILTEATHPRHEQVAVLEQKLRKVAPALPVRVIRDRRRAYAEALSARTRGRLVVITGSLHLVGEIRADLANRDGE